MFPAYITTNLVRHSCEHRKVLSSWEELTPTANAKIFVGTIPPRDPSRVVNSLQQLRELVDAADGPGLRRCLNELLPEANLGVPQRDGMH